MRVSRMKRGPGCRVSRQRITEIAGRRRVITSPNHRSGGIQGRVEKANICWIGGNYKLDSGTVVKRNCYWYLCIGIYIRRIIELRIVNHNPMGKERFSPLSL